MKLHESALESEVRKLRDSDFPLTKTVCYLNNASFGPMPLSTAAAAVAGVDLIARSDLGDMVGLVMEKADSVRQLAARLMHCAPDDIALLHSTSEGVNLVAQGLAWHSGDEVISYQLEHPNAVYPWLNLQAAGVVVKFAQDRGNRFEVDDIKDLVTKRTRVVCLSLVNFANGFRAPIEEIGEFCQERDIWMVVDGVQALGGLEVDVQRLHCDVLSAHGYKWLLSGLGISIVYCSSKAREQLHVSPPGWFGRVNPADLAQLGDFNLELTPTARRFEASEPNLPGLFALEATLRTLVTLGPPVIEARIRSLVSALSEGLEARGYRIVSSQLPAERSNVLSFTSTREPIEAIAGALREKGVAASLRQGSIRLSPHFYNDANDIERFFTALPRA